ncbi:hypothetical protein [Legionella pneumophila]|uniref:Phosphatase n=1 Tax=Legionella pneumophila subsp. pascullei TaxID=91890 RepID=A0AAX2IWM2_LEGPN|nr:hypothetical protein [Legionella pneumophila]AMP89872.1 hypothetical protein AXF35_09325 [Legionella pneumophila subsp. pascullei]AMP92462.1 hypothetical protein AXF36_07475 [Legionella pneumophila subsp. pascullei]AMP95428.1 hypothetical protein AXF37_07365 [Legionella pneumophila subsp. pascullei]SQG90328.1 phosphatase [Legionella pneumophila subsp. pascullei]VEH06489.1 phosphatase [Legionella pneumophila subsp. pascullei]
MGKVNAVGMAEVGVERAKRKETLRVLTSSPFNLDNKEHTQALETYIKQFELSVNQMYLYQAMSTALTAWGGSWIVGMFLPIPEFANHLLAACLYLGATGYILESFSMTDFYEQLEEMKVLYNWCLKNNKESYSTDIDNTNNLLYPDIQRMIKLMSPLCTTDFMVAWPKEVKTAETQSGILSNTLSIGYSIVSAPFSLFSTASKPSQDQVQRIKDLKVQVEIRGLDLGVFAGFEQAIKYFATNSDFRDLLKAKLTQPVNSVKNMLQTTIPGMLAGSNSK